MDENLRPGVVLQKGLHRPTKGAKKGWITCPGVHFDQFGTQEFRVIAKAKTSLCAPLENGR